MFLFLFVFIIKSLNECCNILVGCDCISLLHFISKCGLFFFFLQHTSSLRVIVCCATLLCILIPRHLFIAAKNVWVFYFHARAWWGTENMWTEMDKLE